MNTHAQPCTCLQKQEEVKRLFSSCATPDQMYEKIISLGKSLPTYPEDLKTKERIVSGCQSIMYLDSQLDEGKLLFRAHSEALISAGLAALLIFVYNGQPPEALLTIPPRFLEELKIPTSLSPSRSNGLASLFSKMQKEALQILKKLHHE